MLLILIQNIFNGKKSSKFVIMVRTNYTFEYNLGLHAQIYIFYYNMSHVWSQY